MRVLRARAMRVRPRIRLIAACGVLAAAVVLGVLYVNRHALLATTGYNAAGGAATATQLDLPPGFHATLYAGGLQGPRFDTIGPDGTLFVTERTTGRILALLDPGHTGKATRTVVVADGLNDPTSLCFFRGDLYVGEANRVTRLTLGADHVATRRVVVVPDLPTGGNHATRTVLFGPDGRLYVSIGSTCNDCVESDPRRAAVMVFNADGSGGRVYAHGLRNAVGMAINPWTNEIWVTNNGRDQMGENTPPETIYALQDGGNYGWPRCQAGTIVDPDLGHSGDCSGVVQPLVKMQAHSAPLGLAFYAGPAANAPHAFPPAWRGLFVAFHGSWNRTVPTGYKVIFIPLDVSGHVSGPPRDFVTGWLHRDNTASGRPVGIAVGLDGALYVTDDKLGAVYRIMYGT